MAYKGEVTDFEKRYLFGQREYPTAVEETAELIKRKFPDQDPAPLDFYLGASWNEMASAYESGFWGELERIARSSGTSAAFLTPDDIESYYMTFQDRRRLERSQEEAHRAYHQASSSHWETVRSNDTDAHVLRLDLEDRTAALQLDGSARKERRDALLQEFGRRIDVMRDSGKKSELSLIYLLRSWMRDSAFDHVMAVSHGLPHEDFGDEKVDIRFRIGAFEFPLQVKTADLEDAYRAEHYEKINAKASAAVQEQETTLVTIDTPTLKEAYALARGNARGLEKAKSNRLRKKIVEQIASRYSSDEASLVRLLLPETAPESRKTPVEKVDEDFIIRNSNIAQLVRFGLLDAGVADAKRIKSAKETLLKNAGTVARVFKTREQYLSPSDEDIEKLKTAIEGRA